MHFVWFSMWDGFFEDEWWEIHLTWKTIQNAFSRILYTIRHFNQAKYNVPSCRSWKPCGFISQLCSAWGECQKYARIHYVHVVSVTDDQYIMYMLSQLQMISTLIISRGAEGPGREILQCPPSVRPSVCLSVRPSVCPSVTFSFRTVPQKRIDVFSRNFAGMCTMSWGCAV